jgi:hypothetical protein
VGGSKESEGSADSLFVTTQPSVMLQYAVAQNGIVVAAERSCRPQTNHADATTVRM